jgi:hypothetical protein
MGTILSVLIAVVLLALLGAWTDAPPRLIARDPANPKVRVPATRYRSVIRGYESRRPVDPLPWRKQNQRVGPGERLQ